MTSTLPSLMRFTTAAHRVAGDVIGTYSTSFGMATTLLGSRHRQHVRNIYALVRVADEIVDGVAREAGLSLQEQSQALARYKEETHRAMETGYSTDLVIHAFARTAREAAIDESLTGPFFDSMRTDLETSTFQLDDHARYVYGSAEVVGLMCLRVFLRNEQVSAEQDAILTHGARQLGAAFQNINFLRDLAEDSDRLGRDYLGGGEDLTDARRAEWVQTIRAQLNDARASLPLLPRDCQIAVRSAYELFAALLRRLGTVPVEDLHHSRTRVSNPVKLSLVARAALTTCRKGS